jgi:tetratricopeptide (TPR) repeat protein
MNAPSTLRPLVATLALAACAALANFDLPPSSADNADADGRGRALKSGNWQQAITGFTAALKAEPGNADYHNGLGYAYRKSGKLEPSFVHYRQALRSIPTSRARTSTSARPTSRPATRRRRASTSPCSSACAAAAAARSTATSRRRSRKRSRRSADGRSQGSADGGRPAASYNHRSIRAEAPCAGATCDAARTSRTAAG